MLTANSSVKTSGLMYSSCVQSAMLHASETWPLTKPNIQGLQRNDRAMIRQLCNVKPQDIVTIRFNELFGAAWHWGSGPHSEGEKALLVWTHSRQHVAYRLMESLGLGGPIWHGNSWQRGIAEWKRSAINPHDRYTWRSGVRSAMRAASQLPGRGPTDMDFALYLHINQNSGDDDDVDDDDDDDMYMFTVNSIMNK